MGMIDDWNAEPIPNPDYKPAPNANGVVFLKNDELPSRKQLDWDNDASKGRHSFKPIMLDFRKEYCGHPDEPPEPGPIILVSTSGDDYEVLNKVDPRIKELAVHGKIDTGSNLGIHEANEETLYKAAGPAPNQLTPENKYWILRQLGFVGLGKGKWRHIVFDERIEFDLKTDSLGQLAFRIFKAGYKNAHTEWASQQKQAT